MQSFQPKLIPLPVTLTLLLLPSNHILLNFDKCQKIANCPETLILTTKSKTVQRPQFRKVPKTYKMSRNCYINKTVPKLSKSLY